MYCEILMAIQSVRTSSVGGIQQFIQLIPQSPKLNFILS